MTKPKKAISLAIQKEGKLTKGSIRLLKLAGFKLSKKSNPLVGLCLNFPLKIFFVRDDDILFYVQNGVVDLGIVGKNLIYEKKSKVVQLVSFEFGFCSLVLAVPKNSKIKDIAQLKKCKIATSYPNSVKSFFRKNKVPVKTIKINGSVELAPKLGIADGIADLTSTGKTLELNDLRPIKTIFNSQAILITKKELSKSGKDLVIKAVVRKINLAKNKSTLAKIRD